MGEEQKKEKNRVEGSKAFIEKYFIKKKITQHQIFVEAVGFQLELLGFRCSCWVSVGAMGLDSEIEIQMRRKKRERDVGSG